MPKASQVAEHYTHGSLLEAIRAGVAKLGKDETTVTVEDLGPVDEFHIGGRAATVSFLDQLGLEEWHRVLDVGCGLGGGSRFAAHRYGCRIHGVDLTPEYIETGNALCGWVGLGEQIRLEVGDATALAVPDDTFHRAYMMHVGMNIAAKEALAVELHRVLAPGGRVGIYDVMRATEGDLTFPVPWATTEEGSAVEPPEVYRSALQKAGFEIVAQQDRREFALSFFEEMQAKAASTTGPPPLGLHILMGETAPIKVKNMVENISRGLIAPVEIVAEKRE